MADPCDIFSATPALSDMAGCPDGNNPITAIAGSAFEKIAGEFVKAANTMTQSLASSWLRLDGAQLSEKHGPVWFLTNHLQWIVSWMAVFSLILAAGHMAWTRRGTAAREAVRGVLTLILVTSLGVGTFNLLITFGDKFSTWIVARAINCQPTPQYTYTPSCGKRFGEMLGGVSVVNAPNAVALMLVASLLVIFATVIQVFLLFIQKATLPVLAGTLPLAAAASSTPWGNQWLRKSLGLMVALTLYKPAAAIVYAAAFYQMNTGEDGAGKQGDFMTILTGVVLMMLAVFTLPALMRVAIPAAEAATGAGGSQASLGSVGGAVATGAVSISTGGTSTMAQAAAKGASQAAVSGAKSVAGKSAGVPNQGSAPAGDKTPSGATPKDARAGGGGAGPASGDHTAPAPNTGPSGAKAREAGTSHGPAPVITTHNEQQEGPRGSK